MNEDAADALLKDLEEPPPYAVIVLVADELGPLPETIRSRCQLVPFRRLSERAVREAVAARAPGLRRGGADRARAGRGGPARPARAAARPEGGGAARGCCSRSRGRLPRRRVRARRRGGGAARGRPRARGRGARPREEGSSRGSTCRRARRSSASRRAQRGAEREELLATLEELAAWYRDLVVVAARARARRSSTSTGSTSSTRTRRASGCSAPSAPRSTCARLWRQVEEFNLNPQLALEALFVRLRRELAAGALGGGEPDAKATKQQSVT